MIPWKNPCMAKILVIEDNIETLEALRNVLQSERHSVDCVPSAIEALDFIKTYQYDVLVVDWEMPGMSGIELIKTYRSAGGSAPILMLTGKTATPDKVSGLDSGADYYLTKPLVGAELLSFIRASMRRTLAGESSIFRYGNLELNPDSATVVCDNSKEISVLKLLIEHSQRIVTHDELKQAGWPNTDDVPAGTIRVFLTSLREKLQGVGADIRILSVRGYGYRIAPLD
jgi:two-component system, OmpR family, manganese sensing response regulator